MPPPFSGPRPPLGALAQLRSGVTADLAPVPGPRLPAGGPGRRGAGTPTAKARGSLGFRFGPRFCLGLTPEGGAEILDVSRWLRSKFCTLRTKVPEGPKRPQPLPGPRPRPRPRERAPLKAATRAARRLGFQEPGLQGLTVLRAQGCRRAAEGPAGPGEAEAKEG